MTRNEERIIERYASGERWLRAKALTIYWQSLETEGVVDTLHQRFMSEIDSPCPDYALRARYRQQLVDLREKDAGSV